MEDEKLFSSLLHQKSLFVITGASRGIGKEIAVRLSANVEANSKFLLLSRNESDLAETAEEIEKNNPKTSTEILLCDMSKITESDLLSNFEKILSSILEKASPFDVAFIVHNAGTTGDVSKRVAKFESASEIREHLETNVVSYILLNNIFLRVVGDDDKIAKKRVVINITSLLAVTSLPGFGIYAVGKAGREGFSCSLAAEEADVHVLNYSPGPVKTKMTEYLEQATCDENARKRWKDGFENGSVVTPEQTVTRLLRILDENAFENGAHIDYRDIP